MRVASRFLCAFFSRVSNVCFKVNWRFFSALLLSFSIFGATLPTAQAANLRKYAAIVMDAKTGKVIFSRGADARRFPASVTKVMTLYIVFEELEAGRLKMSSRFKVSKRASGQQPSKLYLKPGSTIAVRDAIRALITKSANDVASVVAENISGSEWAFAERMTRTARRLGMKNTTYKNASGLPNRKQITTVRDQARLGSAMLQHFPQYYDLFKTRSFKYRGKTYGNHNRLLGEYGIDGMKTGYTRASGFNLLTSSRSKGRHIVIAAFGFKSAASRNAHVRELARKYRHKGRTGNYRTAALIKKPAKGGKVASPGISEKLSLPLQIVARPGRTEPIQAPIRLADVPKQLPKKTGVETLGQQFANLPKVNFPVAPARPLSQPLRIAKADIQPFTAPVQQNSVVQTQPHDLFGPKPAKPQQLASAETPHNLLNNQQAVAPQPIFDETARNLSPTNIADEAQKLFSRPFFGPVSSYQGGVDQLTTQSIGNQAQTSSVDAGRWIIQVGAAPSENGAHSLFQKANAQLGAQMNGYRAYVEPTKRKGQHFFRARYAGFGSKQEANQMCQSLKSSGLACLVVATR